MLLDVHRDHTNYHYTMDKQPRTAIAYFHSTASTPAFSCRPVTIRTVAALLSGKEREGGGREVWGYQGGAGRGGGGFIRTYNGGGSFFIPSRDYTYCCSFALSGKERERGKEGGGEVGVGGGWGRGGGGGGGGASGPITVEGAGQ